MSVWKLTSRCWSELWRDESGVVLSSEVVLLGTVLGIGAVAGLAQLRDTVVAELDDLSQTLADLNQSYSMSALQGCSARTAGSRSGDFAEEQEAGLTWTPACLSVEESPVAESPARPAAASLPGKLST